MFLMKNETAEHLILAPLSLYNILEAFLAGTNDSFLVLDKDRNIVLFNDHFHEFIQSATGRFPGQSLPFESFIRDKKELAPLAAAIEDAYVSGLSIKLGLHCAGKRWYEAELHPLREAEGVTGLAIGLFETTANREAVVAVKKSEALFKALVQNSTDIFILTDRHFRIGYISDAVNGILGFDPAGLMGRTGFELVHEDDKEMVAAWLAQLMERPSATSPIEFRARNVVGSWIYLEAKGQNMLDDEQVASLVINCRNIQANKLADQALVQAEQRLTMLLNNTKESFIILNNQLRVTAYNKAAQEHSPYFFNTEIQSGLSLLDLIDPSEAAGYITMLEQVLEGTERENDTCFTDTAGKLHIYHHSYRSLALDGGKGVFITSSDITEKRLAHMAVKENEEKFKTIIEYSFDAIVIVDEQARVVYASPSITSLTGYSPEELEGRSGFEFIHSDDVPELQRKLQSIVNNSEETYADYRSINKDGSLKWIEAKGKNMFDNKHIKGILVSLRDISERKKMMEEQTVLANELIKYNKDLQQFSFITSHNLRAPVANLISLLSLYNHESPADPFNLQLMDKFRECTEKLNETLNDLINVLVIRSKPNADREFVRFGDVTAKVKKNVESLLLESKGQIQSDFSLAEGIEYNPVHMESIFLNLVSNSIKYRQPDRPLQIRIVSEKTSDGVRVNFTDNGIGIDLERYGDRIFGLYQRFHASREGKGIGLYMIKSQITASGGRIEVQSLPGIGTTFSVFFRSQPVDLSKLL